MCPSPLAHVRKRGRGSRIEGRKEKKASYLSGGREEKEYSRISTSFNDRVIKRDQKRGEGKKKTGRSF